MARNNVTEIRYVNTNYIPSVFTVPGIVAGAISDSGEAAHSVFAYIVSQAGLTYTDNSGQQYEYDPGTIIVKNNDDFKSGIYIYIEFVWYNKLS